jgi:hypothetical protein
MHVCMHVCCVSMDACTLRVYVCMHVCMCVCMYVRMHVCCAVVYAYMCVCVLAYMHAALSLNARLNRWSGKQGNLVRHYVKFAFDIFRWVYIFRSLCFSKMQAMRARCNQSLLCRV